MDTLRDHTDLKKTLVIPSDLNAARSLEERLLDEVGRLRYGQADLFAIKLALEEGLINAIKHGNRYDPAKSVRITYDIDERHAEITIADEGAGFRADAVPDPTADENLERPCGRGLMLIRAYMDEVTFNERGTAIRLVKRKAS
jgi:serine/threonine-protein kinase RsbW